MTDQTTTPEETPSTEAEVLAAQVHNKIDKPFRVVSKEEQDKKGRALARDVYGYYGADAHVFCVALYHVQPQRAGMDANDSGTGA